MRKITCLLLVLLGFNQIQAQPIPCLDPPMMTSYCMDACIICDIDGFTGRNDETDPGEAPPGFCTTTVHNGQWIAFIAGSVNLRLRLDVRNCRSNGRFSGLEVGIYEGIDCDNFRLVSNCDGDVSSSQVFTANDLTIGQYYYLVMDGNGGDNCDWTFTVLEGDTRVDPLVTSGTIAGNFTSCPGVDQLYELDFPVGATEFLWELNDQRLNVNAPRIPLTFEEPGFFLLCATAFNACDAAPRTCERIEVSVIPPTDLGKVQICEGDNFEVADTLLNTSGVYEFVIPLATGCDSIIQVELEARPPSFTAFGRVNICEEDALIIGDNSFTETGFYTEVLSNKLGCDSTVTLDLFVVICNIDASIVANQTVCYEEATGSLHFSVDRGTPPFTYTWKSINDLYNGSGEIATTNEEVQATALGIGPYFVTINDDFNDSTILIGYISEPAELYGDLQTSDYNGFQITCETASDGFIDLRPSGGTPPYMYNWNNGSDLQELRAIEAGKYAITLTDAVGCTFIDSSFLAAPPPIDLEVAFEHPNCDGIATGQIQVATTTGGVSPYKYQLDNGIFDTQISFTALTEGNYTLTVKDENACMAQQEIVLEAPIIPILDLGADTIIELADNFNILPKSLSGVATAQWRNDLGLSTYDLAKTTASPVNRTMYQLTVLSEDGCSAIDSILVNISKKRDVFIPNAFSPNGDGINDRLFINGGPEVVEIKSFRIFSRWGEQVYEQLNSPVNDATIGWDGYYKSKILLPNVYVWVAEISFIDGEIIAYYGDVVLIK